MIRKRKFFKRLSFIFDGKIFNVFLIVLFFSFFTFLVYSNIKIEQKKRSLRLQAESLKKEIQILEEKTKKLESEILKQNRENFLEIQARDRLSLKKPGEEVIMILPPKEEKPTSTTSSASLKKIQEKTGNFFKKILERLKF